MGSWALSLVKVPSRVKRELVRARVPGSSESWACEGRIPPRNRARREDDHRIVPGDSLNTALNDDEGMRLFVVDHGSVHRDSLEETTVRLCY